MNAALGQPPDFLQLFNAVPGMLLVLRPDRPRFTILAVTDAYLQATRMQRIDIVGQSFPDVFSGHPDGADGGSIRSSFDRVMERCLPDTMAVQRHDAMRLDATGGSFEARYWRPVNSPVMNSSGQLDYLIHQVEDVTESMRARPAAAQAQPGGLPFGSGKALAAGDASSASQHQAPLDMLNLMHEAVAARRQAGQTRLQLQASEERLRLASDAAELGIWTWQPEGDRLTWENARHLEILGLPRHAAPLDTARLAAMFVHPDDLAPFRKAFASMIRTGRRLFFECRIHCPSGEQRWVELTGQPVRAPGGTLLRLVGTAHDITGRKRAQEALHESRRFLRSSLNALTGLIAVIDELGLILEVNEAWNRFAIENQGMAAGVGVGVGVNYLQQCAPVPENGGNMPAYARGILDVIAGRRSSFELEYPCHSPTQERWFVMRVTRFQSPGPLRVVIIHDECTQQKRIGAALRTSEARYRKLFNSMDEGFCILDILCDAHKHPVDFRFLEVNHAFGIQTKMHGMAGKRLREIDPFMAAGLLEICGQVVQTGKAARLAYEEKKGLRSLWFDIRATRVGGRDSARVAIIFNNISQRINAQDALRISEQRFRALFDNGPVAMYSCDASGAIQEFNASAVRLWGHAPTQCGINNQLCGAFKLYRSDGMSLDPAQTSMARVLRGEISMVREVEKILERPDGSRITIVSNIVPLRNGRGEITGAINSFYDITERSRLERKTREQAQDLAELHQRKDEFLAMLSHELRNPLAPLGTAVQLLRLQGSQAPLQQQALNIIERQVGQLKHLMDDLLEVSRITSGNIRLRPEPVSLQEIVQRAVETTQPLILRPGHALSVSLPLQPVWLMADPTRLEQVLVNLLANAIKYTDEGGCIWLCVELEDVAEMAAPVVLVKVRDTGIGIAPELLPRILICSRRPNAPSTAPRAGWALAFAWCGGWWNCMRAACRFAAPQARAASSPCACRGCLLPWRRCRLRRRPGLRRPGRTSKAARCWWLMTTWMPPTAWPSC